MDAQFDAEAWAEDVHKKEQAVREAARYVAKMQEHVKSALDTHKLKLDALEEVQRVGRYLKEETMHAVLRARIGLDSQIYYVLTASEQTPEEICEQLNYTYMPQSPLSHYTPRTIEKVLEEWTKDRARHPKGVVVIMKGGQNKILGAKLSNQEIPMPTDEQIASVLTEEFLPIPVILGCLYPGTVHPEQADHVRSRLAVWLRSPFNTPDARIRVRKNVVTNSYEAKRRGDIIPIISAIPTVLTPGEHCNDAEIARRLKEKYPDQQYTLAHVRGLLKSLSLPKAEEAGIVVCIRGADYVGAKLSLTHLKADLDSAICSVLDSGEINTDAVRRRMAARDISESDFCMPVAARVETWLRDPTSRPEGVFVTKSLHTGATVVRLKRTTQLPPSISGRVLQTLKRNKYLSCTDVTEACGLRAGDVQRVYEHWDANPKERPAGVILRKEESDVVGARLMTKAEEKKTAPKQTELQGLESKEEKIISVLNAKSYLRQDQIAVASGITQNEVADLLHSWRTGTPPESVRLRMKNPPGGIIEAKLKKKPYKQPSRSNPYLQWIVGFCRARGYTSKSKAVTRRFIYNEMAKAKPSWAQRVKGGDLHGTVGGRLDEVRKGTRNATPIQQFKKGRHVRLWVKPLEN